MSFDVGIRRAAPGDLAAVAALLAQLAPSWHPDAPPAPPTRHDEQVWNDLLDQDHRIVLVATAQQEVIGIADLVLVISLLDGTAPHAILDYLVVSDRYRNQGVGKALIAAVADAAQDFSCCRLELLSSKGLAQAHAFYRATGFKPTAEGFRRNLPDHRQGPPGTT
ncbi:GNAT family N-acetyltransferase [Streptomyces boninensis]|uniref:GNAT family N-acetyltransferase n=1 Tax=Streptomyces boninensis TaxID=2039455 RepID=UPI003B212BE2